MQVMKVNLLERTQMCLIAEKGAVEDLMHLYLANPNPAVKL